jgi:hypothetical protein
MLIPFLVCLFYRSFQPHLDQMEHRSFDNPSSDRLEKVGMRNRIKVAAEISVNDLAMAGVEQLVDILHGIQRAAVWPIGVLLRLQVSLENRLEDQHNGRLCDAILDRGHP